MTGTGSGTVRHLTGWRAAATAAAGVLLVWLGARAGLHAAGAQEGRVFWWLAAAAGVGAGILVGTLPWRLVSCFDPTGLRVGWAWGTVHIPWEAVRRVVIGSLGSGGERDPFTVSLLLEDGREVLYAVLGRRRAADDPATRALVGEARARGIPVEDTQATPEEIRERMRQWREARIKGWR